MTDNKQSFKHQIGALMASFQLVDRSISDQPIVVEHNPSENTVAYTDGDRICFGSQAIDEGNYQDSNSLIALHGLNYHELCHVLYTPRFSSLPNSISQSSRNLSAFNILEDQRIESVFSSLYPSTVPYFNMAIAKHILTIKGQERKLLFPLIYGRSYLPDHLRAAVKSEYKTQRHVDEIADLIDEYKTFTGDFSDYSEPVYKYQKIIEDFARLVWETVNNKSIQPFGHGDLGSNVLLDKGVPDTGKDVANAAVSGVSDADDHSDSGDSDSGIGASSKSDIGDAAQGVVDAVGDDLEVINHVRRVRKVMTGSGKNIYGQKTVDAIYKDGKPSHGLANIANKVGERFRRLVEDSDPGYHPYKDHGRLNIKRAMQEESFDTMFDQWYEGNSEAIDIEVVMALDVSVSMSSSQNKLGEVGWCLSKALSRLGDRCSLTIYTYNTDVQVLYKRGESTPPSIRVPHIHGGTNPKPFMKVARHTLFNTSRKNRVLIMMTDGEWSEPHVSEKIMSELNDSGVVTSLYHYGSGIDKNTHGAQVFHTSSDLAGLIRFSENIVDLTLKNAM